MPLLLTCDCGARFDVEDHLSGQEVNCPECLQPVKAVSRQSSTPRLDRVAVYSIAVALIGAFTVVGSLAAVAVGIAALIRIRRRPNLHSGQGYALTGIGLGLALTGVSLTLLAGHDRVPLAGWLRQRRMTGQLDFAGPDQVATRDTVCLVSRPSQDWGRLRSGTSGDPAIDELQLKRDVILVNPWLHAYVDLHRDDANIAGLQTYLDILYNELLTSRKPLIGDDDEENPLRAVVHRPTNEKHRQLDPVDSFTGHEWTFDIRRGGQTWRFLVRVYRKEGDKGQRPTPAYILRIYAPRDQFIAGETDLKAIADSVRFAP